MGDIYLSTEVRAKSSFRQDNSAINFGARRVQLYTVFIYRALARPIASVLYLETGEILIERITRRQACVGPPDQYLNQLAYCV